MEFSFHHTESESMGRAVGENIQQTTGNADLRKVIAVIESLEACFKYVFILREEKTADSYREKQEGSRRSTSFRKKEEHQRMGLSSNNGKSKEHRNMQYHKIQLKF